MGSAVLPYLRLMGHLAAFFILPSCKVWAGGGSQAAVRSLVVDRPNEQSSDLDRTKYATENQTLSEKQERYNVRGIRGGCIANFGRLPRCGPVRRASPQQRIHEHLYIDLGWG